MATPEENKINAAIDSVQVYDRFVDDIFRRRKDAVNPALVSDEFTHGRTIMNQLHFQFGKPFQDPVPQCTADKETGRIVEKRRIIETLSG